MSSSGIWDRWREIYDTDDVRDGVGGSNPSAYGYLYSAQRDAPPPEVGWSEKVKDSEPVSLYSENVVKEGDTTESVDRESIANLVSTRQQWENIFTSRQTSQQSTPGKKKTPSKWEVKFPNEAKHVPAVNSSVSVDSDSSLEVSSGQTQTTSVKTSDMESAIEREIRLAHEREESLRREKEEQSRRLATQQQEKTSQGQNMTANYVTANAESEAYQPAYEELAEADRGAELWAVDGRTGEAEESDSSQEDQFATESIIEREIRLQNEREAELRKQRLAQTSGLAEDQPAGRPSQTEAVPEQVVVREAPSSEEGPSSHHRPSTPPETTPTSETLIARELRELREREEEVRRMRTSHSSQRVEDGTESVTSAEDDQVDAPTAEVELLSLRTSAPHKAVSDPPLSSRHVKVQPLADDREDDNNNQRPAMLPTSSETPIEREMRLSRERENELRRAKGLPEVKADDYYGSRDDDDDVSSDSGQNRPRRTSQPNTTMRKYASSRLQQELDQQKARERALHSEGKIASSGDDQQEHIQPKKYMEVTGSERADSAAVRNFVTSKRYSMPGPPTPVEPEPATAPPSAPQAANTAAKKGPTGAGRLFSYKEFKQTAESKIERELREMREREEELRMQRSGESPRQ